MPVSNLDHGDIPAKDDPIFGDPVTIVYVQQGGRRAAIADLKSFLTDRGREYLYRLSALSLVGEILLAPIRASDMGNSVGKGNCAFHTQSPQWLASR